MNRRRCATPVRLERGHNRAEFHSGADDLDEWLIKYAWQNQRANNATTFVSLGEHDRVCGYYAITVAGVAKHEAPGDLAKGAPTQMGCLLLARLAVDESEQGNGLGRALLTDCLRRAVQLSREVGFTAVLVHCRDDNARAFYLAQAEFLPSPIDRMQIFLPIRSIERFLNGNQTP